MFLSEMIYHFFVCITYIVRVQNIKKFLLKKGEIRYGIYKIRRTAEETKLSVFRSIHAGCEEVPAKENG